MAFQFCGTTALTFLFVFLKFCQILQQQSMDFEGEVNCVDKRQNLQFIPNSANVLLLLTTFEAESGEEVKEKLLAETVTDITGTFRISPAFPLAFPASCRYTLVVASSCHHLSYHGTLSNERAKPGCRYVYKLKEEKMNDLRQKMKNIQININAEQVQCNWWRKYLKRRRTQQQKVGRNEFSKDFGTFCVEKKSVRKNANETRSTTSSSSSATTLATTKVPISVVEMNKTTEKETLLNDDSKNRTCAASSSAPRSSSPLDVVLLLDGSGSISSAIFYGQILQFAKQLAQNLNLSSDGAHLAIVQFSDRPQLEFGLNSGNNAQMTDSQIDNIAYLNGGTNIGEALLFTLDRVIMNAQGGGGARANSDRMVVVVTDGVSSDDVIEAANQLRTRANAELIAIGIGQNIDQQQLNLITDNPRKVYALENFDQLDAGLVTRSIKQANCGET